MSYNSAGWAHPPARASVPGCKGTAETTQWSLVYNQSNTDVSAPRPATLCYAHQTDLARCEPAKAQSARILYQAFFFFFATSSHLLLVTQGKSTQAHLRRAQVGVPWETTGWNLNISDLESLLLIFFSHSLGEILHIYHKDRVALMHLWQGEYHRSQCWNPTETRRRFTKSAKFVLRCVVSS